MVRTTKWYRNPSRWAPKWWCSAWKLTQNPFYRLRKMLGTLEEGCELVLHLPLHNQILDRDVRCDTMRCDTMRYNAMRYNATRYDAKRSDAMRCKEMWCDVMRCEAMLNSNRCRKQVERRRSRKTAELRTKTSARTQEGSLWVKLIQYMSWDDDNILLSFCSFVIIQSL